MGSPCLGTRFGTSRISDPPSPGLSIRVAAVRTAAIQDLRSLGVKKTLIRLDSAFDAAENDAMAQGEGVDYLVKGNPAHVRWNWLEEAEALPSRTWTRTGRNRRETYISRMETREFEGKLIPVRRVRKITKRLEWEVEDVPPGQRLLYTS